MYRISLVSLILRSEAAWHGRSLSEEFRGENPFACTSSVYLGRAFSSWRQTFHSASQAVRDVYAVSANRWLSFGYKCVVFLCEQLKPVFHSVLPPSFSLSLRLVFLSLRITSSYLQPQHWSKKLTLYFNFCRVCWIIKVSGASVCMWIL